MNSNRVLWTMVAWTALATGVANAEPEGNPKNGLSAWSFQHNSLLGNASSVQALATGGLNTTSVASSTLNDQLHDPAARAVFTELVRCAFPSSYSISFTDRFDNNASYTFTGELGLCNGGWESAAPSQSCQQIVSACILSRVNALDKAVPISIRPQTITAPPTRLVPTETTFRENDEYSDPAAGALIQPFYTLCQFGYDCSWKRAYVGTCGVFLGSVSLQIKDPNACNTPIRVCDGLEGCIQPGTSWPVPNPAVYPDATHVLGSTSSTCSQPLTFSCPLGQTYSVMVRGVSSIPTITTKGSNTGYPADEATVFGFREGAFYGNLFVWSSAMPWTCYVDPASPQGSFINDGEAVYCSVSTVNSIPYPNAYACYTAGTQRSGDSTSGASYMNSRMCDNPDGGYKCFPHTLSRCWYSGNDNGKCQWDPDRGVFHDCVAGDGTTTTYQAITTYLNSTCDLSHGGTCTPNNNPPPSLKRVDDVEGAGDDDEGGGCSVGGSGGLASLAAVLVFVMRRRQRS